MLTPNVYHSRDCASVVCEALGKGSGSEGGSDLKAVLMGGRNKIMQVRSQ